ncbi:MAG TPA: nucleoside triphosphate pyrophosphohydrolase [Candidatus Acidoferrales bacterium]|nr:nucleoside triphosphate pyrophosphohydrolase [Candidatus Acidoferrales bacterium]
MAKRAQKRRRKIAQKNRNGAARKAVKRASRAEIRVNARDRAAGKWFAKLVALQERLCAADGCPWDREQTHASLRKYLIEETYEVLDAMESGDNEDFASELGDLMLQIVFHSVLAEAVGNFTISDVIEAIFTKMVRRHPHVFGDGTAATSSAVLKKWEELKAKERAEKRGAAEKEETAESVLAGVPRSLPAVLEAYQLTRRASHIGFDWDNLQGIFDKIDEEKRELTEFASVTTQNAVAISDVGTKGIGNSARKEEEVGDLLFAAVNVARFLGVDPEIALKKANRKFKERFQWMEGAAMRERRRLADIPRERMEELWNEAKKSAKSVAVGSR